MTTTSLSASSSLLVLNGAALGGLVAAAVLTRARVRRWAVTEPWAITAASTQSIHVEVVLAGESLRRLLRQDASFSKETAWPYEHLRLRHEFCESPLRNEAVADASRDNSLIAHG